MRLQKWFFFQARLKDLGRNYPYRNYVVLQLMQLDSWHCFMSQMMICQISLYYSSITSYSAECWSFINHAEVQQLFLKCLLGSKIGFLLYLAFFFFFVLCLNNFLFSHLELLPSFSQPLPVFVHSGKAASSFPHLTALTQSHHSCQSTNVYLHLHGKSLFTHNCTASRFPLSHNSDPNTSCSW